MKQEQKRYSSDLSDQEWLEIRDNLEGKRDRYGRGRPRKYELREIVNAVMYLQKTGCQWRMLPKDLPPWGAVYNYIRAWKASGVWTEIHDALRDKVREQAGKEKSPSLGIMDTQSVKTTQKGGAEDMMQAKKSRAASELSSSIR